MIDLRDRVAIVTGSTKGIGLAVAKDLAEAGADVVISSRTGAEVEAVSAELNAGVRSRVVGIPCDVSRVEECQSLVDQTVDEFGRVDILVNNAGLGVFKGIEELSIEEWQAQVDTNLGGVFYLSKFAIPHLKAQDDAWIINIGSLACRNSFAGGAGYNASKFGLLGMTEAMMLDLRHEGIRVSVVMPGSVATYFGGRAPDERDAWRLTSEDVASAVLHIVGYPDNALASRVELRPSRPPKS